MTSCLYPKNTEKLALQRKTETKKIYKPHETICYAFNDDCSRVLGEQVLLIKTIVSLKWKKEQKPFNRMQENCWKQQID